VLPLLLQSTAPGPPNIWFAVVFVLILMVVAGLVALGGDRMGYRAARRKIRIGKLRPRTVSSIIAVVTGVLISLVTFGIVFGVWSDFRNALLQYDNLNAQVTTLESDIREARAEKILAEAEMEEARALALAAQQEAEEKTKIISGQEVQLRQKSGEIEVIQQRASKAQSELARKERSLRDLEGRKRSVENKLAELLPLAEGGEKQIEDLRKLKDQLGTEIEALRTEINVLREGEQIIPKGGRLAYATIAGNQLGNADAILAPILNQLKLDLSQVGLNFDPASQAATSAFIAELAGRDPSVDYTVVITSARNVFDGDDVLLTFEAVALSPLIRAGGLLLEIVVEDDTARIRGMGGYSREIPVPAQFDAASLTEFSVSLQQSFVTAARRFGFLPAVDTGEISSPVYKLVNVADDLITRERPFIIQFTAAGDLSPDDDLSGAQVHINSLSRGEADAREEEEERGADETAAPAAVEEEDEEAATPAADDDESNGSAEEPPVSTTDE
jgi:cell division protein FtsB